MIDNKDGTITIKGRVYKEIELDPITKVQYDDLIEGKTIREEYNDRELNETLQIEDKNDMIFPVLNDEFIFKNGNCSLIVFANE